MANEYVKIADVKLKREFTEEIGKLQKEIDAAMGEASIGLLSLIEDALPQLTIEIDNYRTKELTVNGGVPSQNDKGKSYINADSLYNAEQRIDKAGKLTGELAEKLKKDREFGKIGELQIRIDL